ncbi:MAG: ATP-binding protein [Dehalococcoidia bacterium]
MFSRVPIKVRLTLWYTLLLGLILAAFSIGLYLRLRGDLYEQLDDSVESRAGGLIAQLRFQDDRAIAEDLPENDGLEAGEQYVRIYDNSGTLIFDNSASAGGPPLRGEALDDALAGRPSRFSLEADRGPYRVRMTPLGGGDQGVLELGFEQEDLDDSLSALRFILLVGYPLTLAAAIGGGLFLASRALSPIDRLTRMARRMSAEQLGERLDLRLPEDEVGRLARTLDEMLARLDESFNRQRRFTADASHELRSPLTAMKGQIEVALSKQRSGVEYRQTLEGLNEDLDRLTRLTRSLLSLARADAGEISLSVSPVSLPETLSAAVEQLAERASQQGVALTLEAEPISVNADEDLLLQLVFNLLENAIKHTPAGGWVVMRCGPAPDGGAVISVVDSGEGIAAEHLPRIFDRFYRVDKARSRADGGTGLGLAIARWIAEAHGGSIAVESSEAAGSTFTVHLPSSSAGTTRGVAQGSPATGGTSPAKDSPRTRPSNA